LIAPILPRVGRGKKARKAAALKLVEKARDRLQDGPEADSATETSETLDHFWFAIAALAEAIEVLAMPKGTELPPRRQRRPRKKASK
jgi:Ran GTPase-activating protein (RanGAP) involved in mRNA processing and transport